ncbi:MAG: hypothetical protein NT061_05365 [Spirochaetes bacterium]|nr:hypothetical protein [Spirochaetota bacterium]
MSAIDTLLLSEYSRLSRNILRLRAECSQRPKGSVAVKRRGHQDYVYIVKRENGKVVTQYLGKEGTWKVKGAEAKLLERKRYTGELAEAEAQLGKIMKIMKAGGINFVEPTP